MPVGLAHDGAVIPGTGLLEPYRSDAAFDELVAPDGRVRTHWSQVIGALQQLGPEQLRARHAEVERLLRNDGVTYNIHGDPTGLGNPWSLDPLPLLMGSEEWAGIEQGVAQRAELWNLVVADLYGPRELLHRGVLPPELVFDHDGFLRPWDGVTLRGPHELFLYAADLVRGPDGSMVVLGDRAQAPSGAGYALENRVVVSRVFPSLYRDAQVHRLAPFFRALRGGLAAVAPEGTEDPRVVILSPGRFNESYFEHAFLGSSLGYPVVEGPDLTVRQGRVWLRALGGLEPVDVILRRVDGWWCDPLELRPDSRLGVPGLVEAARRGAVSVANPLGTGAIENPGLIGYLPAMARHLLGEDLALPSPQTWWCGDETDRAHVLANLDRLVLKPTSRGAGQSSVFGWELSTSQRDALRRRIAGEPRRWVGQERVEPSTSPALLGSSLEARPTIVRTYAVARREDYLVMAGGLVRVAPSPDNLLISGQSGGISKDLWVLASEPEAQAGLWVRSDGAPPLAEPSMAMPSRAAENLFWLGRYAERAEVTIRLLRCIIDRRNDSAGDLNPSVVACLHGLFTALTHLTATYPGFVGEDADARLADPDDELRSVVAATDREGSLASSLRSLLAAAHAVQDQLSSDTWLVVSNLERELDQLDQPSADPDADAQIALAGIIKSLLALAGLGMESMVRDPGWQFLDAGRRIERAMLLLTLLRSTLVPVRDRGTESLMFESVLKAAESIITYRRRHRANAQLGTLLDLLLLDATNPRSLAYQLDRLAEDVGDMPRERQTRLSEEERLILDASTRVRLADLDALGTGQDAVRWELDALLTELHDLLSETAAAIDAHHFTHLPRQIMVGQPGLLDAGNGDAP